MCYWSLAGKSIPTKDATNRTIPIESKKYTERDSRLMPYCNLWSPVDRSGLYRAPWGSLMAKKLKIEYDAAIVAEAEKYYAAHPMGAAAQRHPHIRIDHGRYIASTARSIKGGVIGFGTSIASALRAFDELYARTPWPRAR